MTSLFPHAPTAKDQPFARTILYLHTARASAMTFSFVSLLRLPFIHLRAGNSSVALTSSALLAHTFRLSSRGFVFGALAGVAMVAGRMWGREEIEWKDRSWRLLENTGEEQTDWAALGAAGMGAAVGLTGMRRAGVRVMSASTAVLGGMGLGMATGVPFMAGTYVAGRKPR